MTYKPDWASDSGMSFYNKVGLELTESQKNLIARYAERSYWDLVMCVGGSIDDPEVASKMRLVPIVLIPGKPLFLYGEEKAGFTIFSLIFIRRDRISDRRSLLHERLHVFLFLTGRRFLGDPFHRDPLFKECEEMLRVGK